MYLPPEFADPGLQCHCIVLWASHQPPWLSLESRIWKSTQSPIHKFLSRKQLTKNDVLKNKVRLINERKVVRIHEISILFLISSLLS